MNAQSESDVLTPWPKSDTGCQVPYAVFTSSKYYDQDQSRIFRGAACCFVVLEAELQKQRG